MSRLSGIDKEALRVALLKHLEADLATVTAAQRASQAGATNEESRAENDKDMRSTETSYLARGQAARVIALREEIGRVTALHLRSFAESDAIAVSALVVLEGEREQVYFVAPAGGGVRLRVRGQEVIVVTPESPLGKALLGRIVDEDVERMTPQGLRTESIVEIA